MKFRLFAMILALSLVVWAQDNPSASTLNSTPAPAKSCCHHASTDAKDAASCCSGNKCQMKDGKSCCAGMDMKDAKSCSGKDMKKCMKQCKKNGGCADGKCCGAAAGEKSAMNCCGTKCERIVQATSESLLVMPFDRR